MRPKKQQQQQKHKKFKYSKVGHFWTFWTDYSEANGEKSTILEYKQMFTENQAHS